MKKAHQGPSYLKYNTHFPVLTVVLRIKNRHYYDFISIYYILQGLSWYLFNSNVALVLMSFTTNTFPLGGMSFISWQTNSLQNPEENAAVPLCIAGLVLNSTGSPTCGVYKFGC